MQQANTELAEKAGSLIHISRAFRKLLAREVREQQELLDQSSRILGMPDPFNIDLGVHDWLRRQPETSYSAWLAWCLRQIKPSKILDVLGIEPTPNFADEAGFPSVECEVPVPYGDDGKTGKLDILLKFSNDYVVAVELKRGSADDHGVNTTKHGGYVRSMECLYPDPDWERAYVLVATEGAQAQYGEFRLRRWAEVTLALRQQIQSLCIDRRATEAAMLTGFVGAVERNLLYLSGPRLTDHIRRSIQEDCQND